MTKPSSSSKQWLKEHFDDVWVQRAREDGYRSRASYKLLEIQKKDHLIKPGMMVVDLGSAPGGWSQVAAKLVWPKGLVIASDLLEDACFQQIITLLEGKEVDLVISDMAPNMSGMNDIDQPRGMYLVELAVDFAALTLRPGGSLLMKVFQGEGFSELLQKLKRNYDVVINRKPEASRSRSREVYVLAKGFKRL